MFGFAKQSNGEVAVSSIPGPGATFTIYLPRSEPTAAAEKLAIAPAKRRTDHDAPCILVVEDNNAVGRFATEMLHDLGYRTVWAANAQEALNLLTSKQVHFDLVFSDVIMPGMNGIELAEAIRCSNPGLPIVLTSGYSSVLAEEGPHGFELVHKPYSVDALSRVLQGAITK